MRISPWVVPPGGWWFDDNGSKIFGENFEDLKSTIASHRSSNKLPEGNPEEEIQDQLLKLHPGLTVNVIKIIATNGS